MATRKRSLVPYICMDVDLPEHERIQACADPGGCLGLWAALAAYIRRYTLAAPRVPRRYAENLWGKLKENRRNLQDMVDHGLLEADETHYTVLRYSPRNQLKADVESSREQTKERVRKSRSNASVTRYNDVTNAFVPTSTSTSISDLGTRSDPGDREGVQGEPGVEQASAADAREPAPEPWAAPPRDRAMDPYLGAAWARGVSRALNGPLVVPKGAELMAVVDIASASSKTRLTDESLHDWLESDGERYARAEAGTVNGFRYRDWVRGGRRAAASGPRLAAAPAAPAMRYREAVLPPDVSSMTDVASRAGDLVQSITGGAGRTAGAADA